MILLRDGCRPLCFDKKGSIYEQKNKVQVTRILSLLFCMICLKVKSISVFCCIGGRVKTTIALVIS
jgi:hypothetical protein